ncbi:rRNA maturation RNase YbeY [Tissierella sp. MSJ-40]|uniref:Endoribonuclease YbeY n=1 Tax=Tissierella simiarum TaxID=2841534 RepID=A0ABS6E5Q2_9FIRM|nr:rRNA maturation RNase YbeY [Tissierella simiarum]MBU5438256.1 rRNA maturation RNase YbeY [Tissierella simiarum]
MEIYIDNRQNKIEIEEEIYEIIEKVAKESLLLEGKTLDYEISLSFVDNEEIKELNKKYRDVDKETDVLSFPIDEDLIVPIPLLGDIIISAEKALEQSENYGHSLFREIAYLTAHSMFHLMGYDHIEEKEKAVMREKEKEVMRILGVFKDCKGE